jgi:hypothetical protein
MLVGRQPAHLESKKQVAGLQRQTCLDSMNPDKPSLVTGQALRFGSADLCGTGSLVSSGQYGCDWLLLLCVWLDVHRRMKEGGHSFYSVWMRVM